MADADVLASMRRTVAKQGEVQKAATSADTTTTAEKPSGSSEETPTATAAGEGDGESTGETQTEAGDDAGAAAGDKGSETSGSEESGSEGTTTDDEEDDTSTSEQALGEGEEAEGDKPADEKPGSKWDAEEQEAVKALFGAKADKVKPDEVTRKLLKVARDNQAAVLESKQQVANLNSHIGQIGAAIVNHDIDTIQEIAEELGGEKLPFDTRTPDDRAKEVADSYNEFYDSLEAKLKGRPDVWAAVQEGLAAVEQKAAAKIAKHKEDSLLMRAKEAGRREAGKPVKGSINKTLETKATQNFTDLKAKDATAQERFDALKPFIEGGVLRDKNRIYALNPQLADKLGLAVEFHQNFAKKYLPKIRESVKAELKTQGILKAPPSGRKQGEAPSGSPAKAKSNGKGFNQYAGTKLLNKW